MDETNEAVSRYGGRLFWEAVLASGVCFYFFSGDIKKALLFTIAFVFVLFVVVTILNPFFKE